MIHEQYPQGSEDYRRTETLGNREAYEREFREPRTRDPEDYREVEVSEPRTYGQRGRYEGREYDYEDYREPRARRERQDFDDEAPAEIKTVYSTSGINIIAGLWLLLAPFALGYSTVETALWNSIVLGIAVAVMAMVRVVRPDDHEGVSWVNFVLGIWLLVSPFVLGLANIEALVWNNIIVGVVILALAATSAMATHRYQDPTTGTRRRNFSSSSSRRSTSRF